MLGRCARTYNPWEGRMRGTGRLSSRLARALRITTVPTAVAIVAILVIGAGSAAGSAQSRAKPGKANWHSLTTKLPLSHMNVDVKLRRAKAFSLDRGGLARLLRNAPGQAKEVSAQRTIVVSLPDPHGKFQRFALHR